MISLSQVVYNFDSKLFMTNRISMYSVFIVMAYSLAMVSLAGCLGKKHSKKKDQAFVKNHVKGSGKTTVAVVMKELEKKVKQDPLDLNAKIELAYLYKSVDRLKDAADLFKLCYIFAYKDPNARAQAVPDVLAYKKFCDVAELAKYEETICRTSEALAIHPECDPLPLEEGIKICDAFMQEMPMSTYVKEIFEIKNKFRERLFNKLALVFDSYLNNGNVLAAETKLKKIKQQFSTEIDKDLKPRMVYLEYKLMAKKGLPAAKDMLATLKSDYPDSLYVKMAESLDKRRLQFSVTSLA